MQSVSFALWFIQVTKKERERERERQRQRQRQRQRDRERQRDRDTERDRGGDEGSVTIHDTKLYLPRLT